MVTINLFYFLFQQQKKLANFKKPLEATSYFDYRKIKKDYWIKEYLLDQIKTKALPIGRALYSEYELLFIFDNAICNTIYAKNIL